MSALLDWKVKQQDTEELEFKQQEMNSDNLRLTKEDLPALVVKKEGKTVKTIKVITGILIFLQHWKIPST